MRCTRIRVPVTRAICDVNRVRFYFCVVVGMVYGEEGIEILDAEMAWGRRGTWLMDADGLGGQ